MRISKALAQNIIYNTMSSFLQYFVNFRMSFVDSRDLLMTYCKKYELDQARTHLLLSELESIQRAETNYLTEEELKEMRKSRE